MADVWEECPMFCVAIPHCPWCGSRKAVRVRTMPVEGDESYTQRMICEACSRRYLIVHEILPSSGKHIAWPVYDDAVVNLAERESA